MTDYYETGERRRGYRFPLQIPIRIESRNSTSIEGETANVGAGGFALFTTESLPTGSEIEYILSLPEFRSMKLRCAGKVLRTSRLADGTTEMAVSMSACLAVEGDL